MPDFIRPNYHVILIHYPLALLGIGIVIELFSFLWPRGTFRIAGRWMILLGAFLTIPALTTGLYALWDAASHRSPPGSGSWADTIGMHLLTDNQWALLKQHVIYNLIGSGVALFAVFLWIASSNAWRSALRIPLLLLLIGGYGCITTAAWFSGEMVYAQGVSIEQTPQPLNLNVPAPTVHPAWASNNEGPDAPAWKLKLDRYVNPLQAHLIFAGFVIAIALAAAALSIRGVTQEPDLLITHSDTIMPGAVPAGGPIMSEHEEKMVAALSGPTSSNMTPLVTYVPPRVPSPRFWLLTLLVALLTAVGGLYVCNNLDWNNFLTNVWKGADGHRDVAHGILAASIIVLALVMAAVTRWSPRSGIVVGFLVFLMLLVIAAQVWMGILLLFDGPEGSLTHMNLATPTTLPSATPVVPIPVVPNPVVPTPVVPSPTTAPAPQVITPPMIPLPSTLPLNIPTTRQ